MEPMLERTTNAVAVGAVTSPGWLPPLSGLSDFAGLMLPILGCCWLILQIISKIMGKK